MENASDWASFESVPSVVCVPQSSSGRAILLPSSCFDDDAAVAVGSCFVVIAHPLPIILFRVPPARTSSRSDDGSVATVERHFDNFGQLADGWMDGFQLQRWWPGTVGAKLIPPNRKRVHLFTRAASVVGGCWSGDGFVADGIYDFTWLSIPSGSRWFGEFWSTFYGRDCFDPAGYDFSVRWDFEIGLVVCVHVRHGI